jgi:hypothetical protein
MNKLFKWFKAYCFYLNTRRYKMSTNNIVPFALFLQCILRAMNLNSYSMFNILFFWLSAFGFKPFLPVAVCSVVATSVSFYGAFIVDFNAVNALRVKYGYSVPFYIFGDFCLHSMPLLLIYMRYWQEAVQIIANKKMSDQVLVGLSSIIVHLLWLHINENMNQIYANVSQTSWLILWNVAILAHLMTMNLLYIHASV